MSFYFKANRGCEEHRGEKERGTEEDGEGRRRGRKGIRKGGEKELPLKNLHQNESSVKGIRIYCS